MTALHSTLLAFKLWGMSFMAGMTDAILEQVAQLDNRPEVFPLG